MFVKAKRKIKVNMVGEMKHGKREANLTYCGRIGYNLEFAEKDEDIECKICLMNTEKHQRVIEEHFNNIRKIKRNKKRKKSKYVY